MISCRKVTDLNAPELLVYHGLNEAQLKHFYEPHGGLFICESPKVIRRALQAGYEPASLLIEDTQNREENADIFAACEGIPVYEASKDVLVQLTGYFLTGGMLCAMKRKDLPAAKELCAGASRVAVLVDIENPTNIGAIFRNAAAMHLDAVLLTAGCSDPLYRRAARVSVGTVFQIPWTFLPEDVCAGADVTTEAGRPAGVRVPTEAGRPAEGDVPTVLHRLGFATAALALSPSAEAIDTSSAGKEEKLAILLGNEEHGLGPGIIEKSGHTVIIPMADGVDSLNVAAASAIAFWELRKRT